MEADGRERKVRKCINVLNRVTADDKPSVQRRLLQVSPSDFQQKQAEEEAKRAEVRKCVKIVQMEAAAHLDGIAKLENQKASLLREAAIAGTEAVQDKMQIDPTERKMPLFPTGMNRAAKRKKAIAEHVAGTAAEAEEDAKQESLQKAVEETKSEMNTEAAEDADQEPALANPKIKKEMSEDATRGRQQETKEEDDELRKAMKLPPKRGSARKNSAEEELKVEEPAGL